MYNINIYIPPQLISMALGNLQKLLQNWYRRIALSNDKISFGVCIIDLLNELWDRV